MKIDDIVRVKHRENDRLSIIIIDALLWGLKISIGGFEFFKTENGVWLTSYVPNNMITFEDKV